MKYSVIVTDSAASEIEDQFNYLLSSSREMAIAARWLQELYAAINALEEFAGYARAREADFLAEDLKQKVFASHRIVFSIDEIAGVVTVHYVRHGRQRAEGEPPASTN